MLSIALCQSLPHFDSRGCVITAEAREFCAQLQCKR
jgi:hypothetical protein